jgi:hypothetical protein
VHFLNDRREGLRKECPEISFAEISKRLATERSQLVPDEKQRYMEIAEQDKERYTKEFAQYQLTDGYKKYLLAQKQKGGEQKEASASTSAPPAKKKLKKQQQQPDKGGGGKAATNDSDKEEATGMDFPVFTEEFLEYNKARESELRQLRKQVTEMEEQNAILHKVRDD